MHSIKIILAFTLYFSILLLIAFFAKKKVRSQKDFISGNRSLSYWVTSLSAHASDMSSWLFMAFPMAAYTQGLSAMWVALGLVLGMFCCWQFIAPKLREKTEELDCLTLSSFFAKTYHDDSGLITRLSTCFIVIYLIVYLSSGLIGMGLLFESVFSINYYVGMTICTLVVLTYTSMGGFIAVAWTDFFQAIFLLLMLMVVAVSGLSQIGGIASLQPALKAHTFFSSPDFGVNMTNSITWGLGYLGLPHVLNKFMSIKNSYEIKKAKRLGLCWQVLSLGFAFSIGIIGVVYFQETSLMNTELIFVEMVKDLFDPFFGGIILCSLLAATISTMDSQLIVVTSLITENFAKKANMKMAKAFLGLTMILTYIIALNKNSSIMNIVYYAWNGLGCSIGPAILAALYMTKSKKSGIIAGIIVGAIVPLLLPFLIPEIQPMIPGFLLSLLTIFVVSALDRRGMLGVKL